MAQAKEFKVNDKVELIDERGDFLSNGKVGSKGTVIRVGPYSNGTIDVRFDDGTVTTRYPMRFKLIKEEEQSMPKFTVGSKVTVFDGSYSYEIDGGSFKHTHCDFVSINGEQCIYEITEVNLVLPGNYGKTNDTVMRRISDGRVFFVQQRFLKEYVPEPKFKRGDWVIYGAEYYRVSSSEVVDGKVAYRITQYPYDFSGDCGHKVCEDKVKEAK